MLKNSSRKSALSAAGAAVTCAALLVLLVQQRRSAHGDAHGDAEVGMRSLQSVAEVDVDGGVQQSDQEAQDGRKKGFSAYFSKLTRTRREAEKASIGAAAGSSAPSSAPAEELRPHDLFIAVKTTKKFHQPRLELLLETWISRNVQQVSLVLNSLFLVCKLSNKFSLNPLPEESLICLGDVICIHHLWHFCLIQYPVKHLYA